MWAPLQEPTRRGSTVLRRQDDSRVLSGRDPLDAPVLHIRAMEVAQDGALADPTGFEPVSTDLTGRCLTY